MVKYSSFCLLLYFSIQLLKTDTAFHIPLKMLFMGNYSITKVIPQRKISFLRSGQSEVREYQREVLPPVTAQPSHQGAVVSSLLEQHTSELSAAQEWDSEWNSQGPAVPPHARGTTWQLEYVELDCSSIQMGMFSSLGKGRGGGGAVV